MSPRRPNAAPRRSGWLDTPPPRVALEIASTGVLAARARNAGGGWEAAATRPLPLGAVRPGLTEANVREPAALALAIRQSLEAVGASGREAALLLPDAAFRVALLEFDEIPHRSEELEALVRFRLRKTLPFDADAAALAVEVMRSGPRRAVVAVLADRLRLDEYEDAFAAAGGRAASVVPAGLAALMALPCFGQGALLLRWHGGSLMSGFGWEELPRLYRVITAEHLTYDDLHPSAAFFRDFHESQAALAASPAPPRILAFGVPAPLVAQLREECAWAEVQSGAAALPGGGIPRGGDAEAYLALAGALAPAAGSSAPAADFAPSDPAVPPEDARATGAGGAGASL